MDGLGDSPPPVPVETVHAVGERRQEGLVQVETAGRSRRHIAPPVADELVVAGDAAHWLLDANPVIAVDGAPRRNLELDWTLDELRGVKRRTEQRRTEREAAFGNSARWKDQMPAARCSTTCWNSSSAPAKAWTRNDGRRFADMSAFRGNH